MVSLIGVFLETPYGKHHLEAFSLVSNTGDMLLLRPLAVILVSSKMKEGEVLLLQK